MAVDDQAGDLVVFVGTTTFSCRNCRSGTSASAILAAIICSALSAATPRGDRRSAAASPWPADRGDRGIRSWWRRWRVDRSFRAPHPSAPACEMAFEAYHPARNYAARTVARNLTTSALRRLFRRPAAHSRRMCPVYFGDRSMSVAEAQPRARRGDLPSPSASPNAAACERASKSSGAHIDLVHPSPFMGLLASSIAASAFLIRQFSAFTPSPAAASSAAGFRAAVILSICQCGLVVVLLSTGSRPLAGFWTTFSGGL